MRVVGGGQKGHGIAVLAGGHLLVELEGGPACGHEDHDVKAEVIEGLLGGDEVAVVDGVEGAAHDAEPVGAGGVCAQRRQVGEVNAGAHAYLTWPEPRTRYLVVVRASAPMGPRACSF